MKITIDCRMIDASGIGVYLKGCLPYFLNSPHSFLLIGNSEKLNKIASNYQNFEIIDCNIKPFSIAELFCFPRKILKKINQTALFYSPFFNVPPFINIPKFTTIHDIIFADIPGLTSKFGLIVRLWFYKRALKKSKKLFTVSEFSKSRIEYFLGASRPIIVTHSAIQPYLLNKELKQAEKKDFILFIGNIKKHKGLWCLLDAFFKAKNEGLTHKLIIVGNKDNFRSSDTEALKKLEQTDSSIIEFTGLISDERLKELLTEASLLVQPSLYEGFGLPPLEAMIMGTRALVSDIPVFKEIYDGFPVVFFRAGDAEDLKEKMTALLHVKTPTPMTLAQNLAEKYTFKKTASIILRELNN